MKKNLTELVFILDRSGSMGHLTNETIGGFNSLIEKQKQEDGECYVTTVLFDNQYEFLHNHVDLKEIVPITSKDYYARGTTALLDAIGTTINSVGNRLSNTPEEERPEKVIFVVTTDGHENASHEFSKEQVKNMVEHQQQKYSWMFMFMGANMDAISEAVSLGFNSTYSKTYTAHSRGVDSVYASVDSSISVLRSCTTDTFNSLALVNDSLCAMSDDEVTAKAYTDIQTALDNVE